MPASSAPIHVQPPRGRTATAPLRSPPVASTAPSEGPGAENVFDNESPTARVSSSPMDMANRLAALSDVVEKRFDLKDRGAILAAALVSPYAPHELLKVLDAVTDATRSMVEGSSKRTPWVTAALRGHRPVSEVKAFITEAWKSVPNRFTAEQRSLFVQTALGNARSASELKRFIEGIESLIPHYLAQEVGSTETIIAAALSGDRQVSQVAESFLLLSKLPRMDLAGNVLVLAAAAAGQ